jgi:hypothetical protein
MVQAILYHTIVTYMGYHNSMIKLNYQIGSLIYY